MTRVLLLCPEPGRPAMAGVGIRFLEMARHLGPRHEVTLGFPNDPAELSGLAGLAGGRLVRYDRANLGDLARAAEVVVLHAHVSNLYFDQGVSRPLVVDLYDPFPVENLNYFRELGDGPYRHDRATLERQLREGDLFLCSSAEQRLFYLGMLYALGRLNPETYFADFTLANLVREVPFGVYPPGPPGPATPGGDAIASRPFLRGVLPGVGPDDPILFFGGIYDWYDPMLLLAVLPALMARFPTLRVVFSANPNPASTPQGTYAEVLALARETGWLDRHVYFVPWVEAEARFGLYRESTVAAVLHRPRFEAELSMRTRVLDYLGAGLPVVATAGGATSRLLAEERMGIVVPEGDQAALTAALTELLASESRRAGFAARGKEWAARHGWPTVLAPLNEFLDRPRIDPYKHLYPPGSIPAPRPPRRFGRAWWRALLARG